VAVYNWRALALAGWASTSSVLLGCLGMLVFDLLGCLCSRCWSSNLSIIRRFNPCFLCCLGRCNRVCFHNLHIWSMDEDSAVRSSHRQAEAFLWRCHFSCHEVFVYLKSGQRLHSLYIRLIDLIAELAATIHFSLWAPFVGCTAVSPYL